MRYLERARERAAEDARIDADEDPPAAHPLSQTDRGVGRILSLDESRVMSQPTRVLLIEDHAILTSVLSTALRSEGFEVEAATDLGETAILDAAQRFRPEVVLLDLMLAEDRVSTPLVRPLRVGGSRVVILTGSTDRRLHAECLEAGAVGVVNKAEAFDRLVSLIRDVALGRPIMEDQERAELMNELWRRRAQEREDNEKLSRLTGRERAVLSALVQGKQAEAIASEQFVSVATVRSQIRSILEKLGVNSQLAAVALVRKARWPGP